MSKELERTKLQLAFMTCSFGKEISMGFWKYG